MGAGLALAVGLGAAGAAQAEVESKDPIKLTLHDWTGQLITTKIMGSVLQKAGYNVEYVQADYIAQFAGLKTGDLHVAMEMRSEEHTSELQSLMRISYAVFCLKKKNTTRPHNHMNSSRTHTTLQTIISDNHEQHEA